MLPCFAALDDLFEFEHHSHKFRVLNRSENPVERHQVLRIGFVSALAYLEHIFSIHLLCDQKLIQFHIKLLHVILEDSVALETLLICIIFELEAVLISQSLEELLEVALLAEGFESLNELQIGITYLL